MISTKKQLFFVPFPFLNIIPLIIIVFINRKYIPGKWQLRLIPYFIVVLLCSFLIEWILEKIFYLYVGTRFLSFLVFYLSSLIVSVAMLLFQKKNGIT